MSGRREAPDKGVSKDENQSYMDDDSPYDIRVSDDEDAHQRIDARQITRTVAETLRQHHCKAAQISVALVDDAHVAELNRRYLDRCEPTDVLSFDLSDDRDDSPLEGEIVISWETAARQARAA